MKEIVNQILKEEEIGRAMLTKAKQDAQNLILKAQKDSKDLFDKTAEETKDITSRKQKEAENKFLAERERILQETQSDSIALRKSRENDIPAIAKEIFQKIIDIKL
ncbi:MAG: hypothetical protein WCY05_03205 [Candidatus Omnitrophota bacterium]